MLGSGKILFVFTVLIIFNKYSENDQNCFYTMWNRIVVHFEIKHIPKS